MIKFFINAIKESSFLILRYLIVSLGVMGITIVINGFDIEKITYYNSVIVLFGLIEYMESGLTDALEVYINQNIKSREKVIEYIKIGFIICIFYLLLMMGGLWIAKNIIFEKYFEITIPDNYYFYNVISISFSISIICLYFQDIIKILGDFKIYFKSTVLYNVIMFISFIILNIFNLSIINIAYAISIASITVLIVLLTKNVTQHLIIKFNIIELFQCKIQSFGKVMKTASALILENGMWNVYDIIEKTIYIKVSLLLFNTVEYFNNVFYLLEGAFYSLMTVCVIKISKKIGEYKFDEAYKISKNTIWSTVLLNLTFIIIYLIARSLIIRSINPELVNMAKNIDIVLLICACLRIIDWAFSYNVLIQGGKTQFQVYLEAGSLIYSIALLVSLPFIIGNIYLILALTSLDSVIRITINIFYFKSRKWLNSLAES